MDPSSPAPPARRKHAFYVSPEGAAPASEPTYENWPVPPTAHELRQAESNRQARLGLYIFLGGLALAIVSCAATGGSAVLIASGPMAAGIGIILRANR